MFFIYTTFIAINIFFIPEYFEYFIIFNIDLLNFIYELKNKNKVLQLISYKKIVNESEENSDSDSDNEKEIVTEEESEEPNNKNIDSFIDSFDIINNET